MNSNIWNFVANDDKNDKSKNEEVFYGSIWFLFVVIDKNKEVFVFMEEMLYLSEPLMYAQIKKVLPLKVNIDSFSSGPFCLLRKTISAMMYYQI